MDFRIYQMNLIRRDEFYEYMKRSDERFEQLFNELISMEESNHRFEAMERRFDNLEDWVGIVVGDFKGERVENSKMQSWELCASLWRGT